MALLLDIVDESELGLWTTAPYGNVDIMAYLPNVDWTAVGKTGVEFWTL